MTKMTTYAPGQMCWVDLSTHDMDAAKRFYGELFGWTVQDQDTAGGPPYAQFVLEGRGVVAGLGLLPEALRAEGVAPAWNSYVSVTDADAIGKKAIEAGGEVAMPAMDIMGEGRMSVLRDPEGATLSTWQPGRHVGAAVVNEPRSFAWNELATHDIEGAMRFYGRVFGWTFTRMPGPTRVELIENEGRPNGHLLEMNDEWGEMPSAWAVYFAVEDCDATVARAERLGGKVLVPAMDIPQGRFAVLRDDQGSHFYAMRLADNLG